MGNCSPDRSSMSTCVALSRVSSADLRLEGVMPVVACVCAASVSVLALIADQWPETLSLVVYSMSRSGFLHSRLTLARQ